MNALKVLCVYGVIGLFVGCGGSGDSEKAEGHAQAEEVVTGDVVLFDGTDFNAWRMDKKGGWVIDGDTMTMGKGGSIWTRERFGNFVLDVEFMVSPECNSGIFFRTDDLDDPVQTGMEMQVLDSAGKPEPDKHDSGAMYDLLEPSVNAMKPADEWNGATITCNGSRITVDMNGQRIVDMNTDDWDAPRRNPDGTENKFKTALRDFPREGHIGFQDHGHPVWYRNVRLHRL